MKFTILKFTSILIAVCCFSGSLNAADYKKGLWEMTFTTSMQGMPFATSIPIKTQTECVETDEFIPQSKEDDGCSYSTSKSGSSKVEWTISCQDGKMKGNGEMLYSGKSMSGNMNVQMELGGNQMTIATQIVGKYLGPCK